MASIITGNGMSAALKQQQKAVRAAVEQRPRKADNHVDREHWLQPVYRIEGEGKERRVALAGYEPPRIDKRTRQAVTLT